MSFRHLATWMAVLATSGIATAQFSLFLPNGAASGEGPSSTPYPWNRNNNAIRVQQVYDSTHFTSQGVSYPIRIVGARWRANATTSSWTGTLYTNVEVSAATSTVDYALISSTFASNRGIDYTQLYSGPVNVIAGTGNGSSAIGPDVVDLTFTSSFLYDPSSGRDFLAEVAFHLNSWNGGSTVALDAFAAGSQSSRVYNLTDPNATTGTAQQDLGLVIELLYNPASGLFAGFGAAPTSGPTPLVVSFSDASFTSDPSGIQTWAWDFDGDAVIDSNAQNPTFTYNTCGSYDVTLRVTDTQHPASSLTQTDLVSADPQLGVGAEFFASTVAGVAPFRTRFFDTSTGSPTSWSWDLNGDAVPDSVAQNPSYVYATPGTYTVSLVASNACFSGTETKTAYIYVVASGTNLPADKLAYAFDELRGTTVTNVATGGPYPAFGVLPSANWQRGPGLGRARFDTNEAGFGCLSQAPSGTPTRNWVDAGAAFSHTGSLTITWWARRDPSSTVSSPFGYFFGDGSFRCFMGSAGILFSGGAGSSLATTYTANFQNHLVQGVWNHYAVVIDDTNGVNTIYENGVPHASPRTYTSGTYSYGGGSTRFAVGANGSGGTSPSSVHFDLDDFRMYSAALSRGDLIATMAGEYASNGLFDAGCAGPGGIPVIGATQRPRIPNPTYALALSNLEAGRPASLVLGVAAHLGGILPLDLSGVLGAGCALTVLPEITFPFATGAGSLSIPIGLPADPLLNGVHGYVQAIVIGTAGATSRTLDVNLQID